jgi:beta-lactamase class C
MRFITGTLLMAFMTVTPVHARAQTDGQVQRLISREVQAILPSNGAGGVAVAVRMNGKTSFFNYGMADLKRKQPVTSDSLFNLASIGKAFDATLLALAVQNNELKLDDAVVKYVPELEQGGDARAFTFGQLATHTSGLLLPQDHPPWPEQHYTLPEFLRTLNGWKADRAHKPGKQPMYTHAGYILLHLALERRLGGPLGDLLDRRILKPLGMTSTTLPMHAGNPRGDIDPALKARAVQGYDEDGRPIGEPGDIQGYYLWPGTAQMFSSARDMAVFLAANLGELTNQNALQNAMTYAHQPMVPISAKNKQGLAWEINLNATPIIEKNGGLNNSSTYIGMIPSAKIGVVILTNLGNQDPAEMGRRLLLQFAPHQAHASAPAGH